MRISHASFAQNAAYDPCQLPNSLQRHYSLSFCTVAAWPSSEAQCNAVQSLLNLEFTSLSGGSSSTIASLPCVAASCSIVSPNIYSVITFVPWSINNCTALGLLSLTASYNRTDLDKFFNLLFLFQIRLMISIAHSN